MHNTNTFTAERLRLSYGHYSDYISAAAYRLIRF
jgi:hypothetical protein